MTDPAHPVLRMAGVGKTFGLTRVLRDVDLTVRRGEVHGLLGQNGSGKSTLIKILAGFHTPDEGTVELDGVSVELPLSAADRRDHRLRFVHQDLALLPSLTVLENLIADDVATGAGIRPRRKRAELARATAQFDRFGISLRPDTLVRDISRLDRAKLAIARAVSHLGDADGAVRGLLVLDEPTAFLPQSEVAELIALMQAVAAQGAGVLFVSHDLDEVLTVTDRVSVLRDGELVGSEDTASLAREDLVRMIVGRTVSTLSAGSAPVHAARERPRLQVSALRGGAVEHLDLSVQPGEVVGLTGVIGSGFDEVTQLLFGAQRATGGSVAVDDLELEARRLSPSTAINAGVAYLPSDRAVQGSAPTLTVGENVTLLSLRQGGGPFALIGRRLERHAGKLLRDLDVRPPQPGLAYASLSGGNQQKAMMAKWLVTGPKVLLLSEPTQGVDVGAREQIFTLIAEAARQGCAVVCSSSDLDQLAQICNRVLLMRRGVVSDEVHGQAVTKAGLTDMLFADAVPRSSRLASDA
ncbi:MULTISPECIES: sugar ABC transporter ATP-binding protein [unclassified Nocardioides]|uniref:sugar ABC transporter ATP-binding protein n=1 Tax=unclassified Nocardioides TaxID=2615069 RepID=UPI0009EF8B15|nr:MULTISPECIES: sugar ABC transporter ATP-binding protein [unclassified Nocardioides]GAW47701.1 ABC transporter-like protein [Nocardioides sp. PD653-B2]GAW56869.1 ABC transporter-like protein [Nocardioides sp. PD653]